MQNNHTNSSLDNIYSENKAKTLSAKNFNTENLNVGVFVPKAFSTRFVFNNGQSDSNTAKLLSFLWYWHKPKKVIDKETGHVSLQNKFFGKRYQTSYSFLQKELRLSRSTIRRSFITLEKIGYAKRIFEDVSLCGQTYNSRLFVELNDKFKTDFNLDDNFEMKNDDSYPTTPSSLVDRDMVIDDDPPGHGGKAYKINNKVNNLDNRSRSTKSNLKCKFQYNLKSNFNLNEKIEAEDIKGNSLIKFSNKDLLNALHSRGVIDKGVTLTAYNHSTENKDNLSLKRKYKKLSDFYPLSNKDCQLVIEKSGRDFSVDSVNKVMADMAIKDLQVKFYSKRGVLGYMSKALQFEKRDEAGLNGNISFLDNLTLQEKKQHKEYEKYLAELEYSLDTSPEMHLKKKLAATLNAEKAYRFLTNLRRIEIKQEKCIFHMQRKQELTKADKQIIFNQVRAVYMYLGVMQLVLQYDNDIEMIEAEGALGACFEDQDLQFTQQQNLTVDGPLAMKNLAGEMMEEIKKITDNVLEQEQENKQLEEIAIENKLMEQVANEEEDGERGRLDINANIDSDFKPDQDSSLESANDIWGKIRLKFSKIHSKIEDRSWLGELKYEIDEPASTIRLIAKSKFYATYIVSNYLADIEAIGVVMGYKIELSFEQGKV